MFCCEPVATNSIFISKKIKHIKLYIIKLNKSIIFRCEITKYRYNINRGIVFGGIMKTFLNFLTIFLFFAVFSGCFEDTESTKNIDCEPNFVYNSRMEMCVFDICEHPEAPKQYECEMGCIFIDRDNFFDYACYRENPYQ